jgi:hypothetical protein
VGSNPTPAAICELNPAPLSGIWPLETARDRPGLSQNCRTHEVGVDQRDGFVVVASRKRDEMVVGRIARDRVARRRIRKSLGV